MRVSIAPAKGAEREWCARLMASSEPWTTLGRGLRQSRRVLQDRERDLFVAHARREPCGFIFVHPHGLAGSPYIATVAVAHSFRGLGIGTRLLRFAEQRYRRKARHIFLCVSSFNTRAASLYERLGYAVAGELRDYVVEGASEILMHKRLDPGTPLSEAGCCSTSGA